LNVFVQHPETAQLYNRANMEALEQGRDFEKAPAGAWYSRFPGLIGPTEQHRISLRSADDLREHADELLSDIARYVFPEIDHQLQLPLSRPTPLWDRPMRPSREELSRESLSTTVEALRAAGITIDIPEELES
jgi:hypothetical protein